MKSTSSKARRIAQNLQTVAFLSLGASVLLVFTSQDLPWPILVLPIPSLLFASLFSILADIATDLESLKRAS
ncbi:MAG TPA: hypothetical protein VF681_01720 [Abditibacteriaceae bacterium]|jgi:hypothetical protein